MSPLVIALLAGIGTTRVIETLKEAIPIIPPPWAKSLLSVILAVLWGVWFGDTRQEQAIIALGSAGVSMLAHDTGNLMSMYADRALSAVLNPQRRQR